MSTIVPAKYRHRLEKILGIKVPKGADIRVGGDYIQVKKIVETPDTFSKDTILASNNGRTTISSFKCVTDGYKCVKSTEPVPPDVLTTYKQKFINPNKVRLAIAWATDPRRKFKEEFNPPPVPF